MSKLLKEFREFAVQGNMIDMAVGMIIGAAFKDLVNSLVSDMVMPVIAGGSSSDRKLRSVYHRDHQLHYHGVRDLHGS